MLVCYCYELMYVRVVEWENLRAEISSALSVSQNIIHQRILYLDQ